jgi:hypothetical protein
VLPEQTQTITIKGTCFGTGNTGTQFDSDFLMIFDTSTTPTWGACSTGDSVTCTITTWTNKKIVFAGYGSAYGPAHNWVLVAGDKLQITVKNAQTSKGPAKFKVRVQ